MIQTSIYDLYWRFATERQNIFFNRLNNKSTPWTSDYILQTYKFTNTYRASDRVSQYLINNVIYTGESYSEEDLIFRILLFKFFNKIETWKKLENKFGSICLKSYDEKKYGDFLEELWKGTEMKQQEPKKWFKKFVIDKGLKNSENALMCLEQN